VRSLSPRIFHTYKDGPTLGRSGYHICPERSPFTISHIITIDHTMRAFWRCSNCAGLLMLVMAMTQWVEPTAADNDGWEVLWVEKSVNVLKHVKRKDVCSLADWSLCPASVGGGCCPGGFACDTASCYATTGGASTCNGKVGYYACPLTAGPGKFCKRRARSGGIISLPAK
jgi:hypothetical protein